jgi:hypothetical protein
MEELGLPGIGGDGCRTSGRRSPRSWAFSFASVGPIFNRWIRRTPLFRPLLLVFCAGLIYSVTLWKAPAQSFLEMVAYNSESEPNSFTQSMYCKSNIQCVASMRVDHLWKEFERKGFFRIGVLPMVVMKGVTFEIKQPALATNALTTLRSWTGRSGASRLELRQVVILVDSELTNRLSVGCIHLGAEGQWELRDGVTLCAGSKEIHSPQGTLQVTGENTGRLVLNISPPVITNLITSSN